MATTDYGTISQRTAGWAATKMLEHAEPILVLSKFGDSKPQPKNKAEAVKFRRPVPFGAVTTPLVEGVTPTAQAMAYEDVPATLEQWGAVVEITDVVADLAEDPVLADASMLCGEQAAETIEAVTWGVLKGATNVLYANGSATGDVNTAISKDKLRSAVRALQAQRAKPITRMLDSSPDHSTTPIEGGYVAFAHTDMAADIRDLAGFTPVAQYGSRKPLCPEELGSVENVRFILSPLLSPMANAGSATLNNMVTSGTKVDIYDLVIIGMNAYGLVPLKGTTAIKPSVINPNTVSKSDPLGQKGYVGWKAYYTALVLNQAWIARIRCGVKKL